VYPASSVRIEEDAGPVVAFVKRPSVADFDIRSDAELLAPALPVDSSRLVGSQMNDESPAAIPARVAGPSLVRNVGHYYGQRAGSRHWGDCLKNRDAGKSANLTDAEVAGPRARTGEDAVASQAKPKRSVCPLGYVIFPHALEGPRVRLLVYELPRVGVSLDRPDYSSQGD